MTAAAVLLFLTTCLRKGLPMLAVAYAVAFLLTRSWYVPLSLEYMPCYLISLLTALSWLARVRFHTDVRDFHSGLRAFRTGAARRLGLRCPGMEFATELVARFAAAGLPIAQVPIHLRPDGRGGPSHLNTVRDGLRHLHLILTLPPTIYQETVEQL